MEQISLVAAFTAGLITFFAPCTFITLPVFFSYLSVSLANTPDKSFSRWRTFAGAVFYVCGFLLVFTLLGLTASKLGQLLFYNKEIFIKLGALIIIFFGLFILFGEKFSRLQFLYQEKKFRVNGNFAKKSFFLPFIIGITAAFAWTPCIGPILGSILLLASTTQNAGQGALLLFVYGLGINLPFLLLAMAATRASIFVKRFKSLAVKLQKITAVIMIILGIILFLGWFNSIFAEVYQIFVRLGYRPV